MIIVLIVIFMLHVLYLEIKLSRSFRVLASLVNAQTPPPYQIALARKVEANFAITLNRLSLVEEKINFIASSIGRLEVLHTDTPEFAKLREERYKNMRRAFGGKEEGE